jgi:hypothetical protein
VITASSLRHVSLLFLAAAVLLFLLGEYVFKSHIQDTAFLLYWAVCSMLLLGSVIFTLLDLFARLRQARVAQQSLFQEAMRAVNNRRLARACDKAPQPAPPVQKTHPG